jgi:hypothetical protein
VVLGEARVQRNVEKTRQRPSEYARRSSDRSRIELSAANDTQATLALRDQDVAIREERHAPRMRQASRHRDDTNRKLRREERMRQRWRRRRRPRRLRIDERGRGQSDRQSQRPNSRLGVGSGFLAVGSWEFHVAHGSIKPNATIVFPEGSITSCLPSSITVVGAAPQMSDPVR